MKLAVAADHAGAELKDRLRDRLRAAGHEVEDLGTHGPSPVDYPDFAQVLGGAVAEGRAARGVLVCGSGVGASIAANKIPGIRAGLCHDFYSAHQGVEHDDMNVLVLGARVVALEAAWELVQSFVEARFNGEARHVRRLGKVRRLEAAACAPLVEPVEADLDAQSSELNPISLRLPLELSTRIGEELARWREQGKLARLWARDPALWTRKDEGRWLDWLDVVDSELADSEKFARLRDQVTSGKWKDVVLLGMGGSSLAAEVLCLSIEPTEDAPDFHVLDSTDPARIRGLEERIELGRTLFVVSSKSGTTLEPNLFFAYFHDRVRREVGAEGAGQHFVAITDPGSALERLADEHGFAAVFRGRPGIGGRYSALSDFGMVPAALMGLDVPRFLEEARAMESACGPETPPERHPAATLGVALGTLARLGRDKVTLVSLSSAWDLGAWLEQLLAESTGKRGRGLIPVFGEAVGEPASYGNDRVFVHLEMDGSIDPGLESRIEALCEAGHPLIRIRMRGPYSLGQEFFRWELATAIAGSVLGIDPFDQPDVEAAKEAARRLTREAEAAGKLPAMPARLETPEFAAYGAVAGESLEAILRAHLDQLRAGDYFAVLAYLDQSFADEDAIAELREDVRRARRVATCVGFGPRYLHSTGQAYKGGPASGVFLLITADDARDLPVPGHRYGFSLVKAAQAQGDFEVLQARGRRCLRVHLKGGDALTRLRELRAWVERALRPAAAGVPEAAPTEAA